MARSSSEKRKTGRAKSWNRITIFQRPSSIRSTAPMPAAAISGVTSASLPVGEYPTFRLVLAMAAAYPISPVGDGLPYTLAAPGAGARRRTGPHGLRRHTHLDRGHHAQVSPVGHAA